MLQQSVPPYVLADGTCSALAANIGTGLFRFNFHQRFRHFPQDIHILSQILRHFLVEIDGFVRCHILKELDTDRLLITPLFPRTAMDTRVQLFIRTIAKPVHVRL